MRIRNDCHTALAVGLLLLVPPCLPAFAQAPKDPPPVPSIEEIDAEAVREAAGISLSCAVRFLMTRAETNDYGLVVEPMQKRRQYIYRYTKKLVEEPVYRYETYTTHQYQRGASTIDGGQMKEVKASRAVEKIGTRKVERDVSDPNGEMITTNVQHEIWQTGFLAQNAAALYTFLQCGIPETNSVVERLAVSLKHRVTAYGLPDATWDVAWLSAAFANIQRKDFAEIRGRLINKLLEGQVTDGAARGLWGPICVNSDVLAAMLAYEQTIQQDLAKRRQQLTVTPDSKLLSRRVSEAEVAVEVFQKVYTDVSMQGLRFDYILASYLSTPSAMEEGCEYPVAVRGFPFYLYNQTLADLESTAVALFALREAADNRCLPAKTSRPGVEKGRPILPVQETDAILARAAGALAALQKADGSWNESNVNQPSAAFSGLGLKSPMMQTERVLPLESPQSPASVGQGYGAMVSVGHAVGMPRLWGRYGRSLATGRRAQCQAAEAYINGSTTGAVSRVASPYDFYVALRGIDRLYGTDDADRPDLWVRLTHRLLNLQDSKGTWGSGPGILLSSSVWARNDIICREKHAESQKSLPAAKREPYDAQKYARQNPWWWWGDSSQIGVLSTLYASLFLSDGLRPPVAGYLSESAGTAPSALSRAVSTLKAQKGIPITFQHVPAALPSRDLRRLPVLYWDAGSAPGTPEVWARVKDYLPGTGLLIVESKTALAGEPDAKWSALVPSSRLGDVPESAAFLAKAPAWKARMRALLKADGTIAALLIQRSAAPASAGAPVDDQQLVTMLAAALEDRAGPGFFKPELTTVLDPAAGDPLVMRVEAMKRVNTTIVEMPAAADPVKPPTEAKPPKPPEPPKKQDDEDLRLPPPPPVKIEPRRTDEVW